MFNILISLLTIVYLTEVKNAHNHCHVNFCINNQQDILTSDCAKGVLSGFIGRVVNIYGSAEFKLINDNFQNIRINAITENPNDGHGGSNCRLYIDGKRIDVLNNGNYVMFNGRADQIHFYCSSCISRLPILNFIAFNPRANATKPKISQAKRLCLNDSINGHWNISCPKRDLFVFTNCTQQKLGDEDCMKSLARHYQFSADNQLNLPISTDLISVSYECIPDRFQSYRCVSYDIPSTKSIELIPEDEGWLTFFSRSKNPYTFSHQNFSSSINILNKSRMRYKLFLLKTFDHNCDLCVNGIRENADNRKLIYEGMNDIDLRIHCDRLNSGLDLYFRVQRAETGSVRKSPKPSRLLIDVIAGSDTINTLSNGTQIVLMKRVFIANPDH